MLYKSIVLPHLEYCDTVWDTCAGYLKDTVQKLQNRACKIILRRDRLAHTNDIHRELKLWKLHERRKFHCACVTFRCKNELVPSYLSNIYQPISDIHHHSTRYATAQNLFIVGSSTESGKSMFKHRSVILWNSLPAHLKNCHSLPSFKRAYISWKNQNTFHLT